MQASEALSELGFSPLAFCSAWRVSGRLFKVLSNYTCWLYLLLDLVPVLALGTNLNLSSPFTLQVGLTALLVIAFERICGGRRGAVDIWEVVCLVKRINLTSTLTHLLAVFGFGAEGRGSKG